jgi:hypothetical protein
LKKVKVEVNPEDNMSLSELIKSKYKRKINKLSTPAEAANVLIKDVKDFDVNDQDYYEGTKDQ